ncbi:hypothetical protein E2C01_085304 [Portunus trituberculatus]|uniref:Uncharacterized protein n=1 Tax=Portunus trituberculatus TaxID=210409 RepID=A0A5B7JA42_PORTR|nr:hypothetical protein [Portunus trituberculatus]
MHHVCLKDEIRLEEEEEEEEEEKEEEEGEEARRRKCTRRFGSLFKVTGNEFVTPLMLE